MERSSVRRDAFMEDWRRIVRRGRKEKNCTSWVVVLVAGIRFVRN
jgi:hypothetical protein